MRPLEDTDKNVWTAADFSVMMIVVYLGPLQIGRTDLLSDKLPQCLIHSYQPLDVRPTREYPTMTIHRPLIE
ncbi:hypothetical protein TNCV_1419571 [Trichonephila clavipes]|nr:hypothetical protein TNCV_1419571 [Trichonephila clavipes]